MNLSDGLLEADLSFTTLSNDIQPAIGFYMNQDLYLGNDNAIASANDALPLVKYASDSTKGPSFQLRAMPEFYPYQSEEASKPVEEEKPHTPSIRRIGIETLTIQPVAFQLSTDEEKDYVMTLRLPNGTTQTITSRTKDFSVSQSGSMEAFVEVNNLQSDPRQVEVDNIIAPFTEIEGTYIVKSKDTSFTLHNFEEVMQELAPFQDREKLKLIMETKGKKTEIKKAEFTVKNKDIDLDDFAIFVESEYGEVLSPIAEVAQPVPPVVRLSQAMNYGYARAEITTETGDDIYYRLLDEDHDVMRTWQRYKGVFEERFIYIEAVTRTQSGTESESVLVENPYVNAVVQAPIFEPDENGSINVSSAEGTILYYWNGSSRDDYYWNGNSRNSNEWLSVGSKTKTFYLAEGETLVVYAKSDFGSQESVDVRYTRAVNPNEAPDPPTIEKIYHHNRIEISGTNYDEIWYRYAYLKKKNDQKTTKWERSYDDVVLDRKDIIFVEAYTVNNEIISETSTWSREN